MAGGPPGRCLIGSTGWSACRCRLPARPAAGRSPSNGGRPAPGGPPTAQGDPDHPVRGSDRPLWGVPAAHPAPPSRADLGCAGLGRRPGRLARGRVGRLVQQGAGLPAGKVARLLGQLGLELSPGGVTQAVARAARRCEPTYTALAEGCKPARSSHRTRPAGGSVAAVPGCGPSPGRALSCTASRRDAGSRCCGGARRGVCGAVGTRRVGAVPQVSPRHPPDVPGASAPPRGGTAWGCQARAGQDPHAVRRILHQALAVRDACDAGELDPAEAAEEASRLGAAVARLLAGRTCYAPNRKLLAHLGRERDALFTFLVIPEVRATNWRAEHAIRPAVVSRKTWGGDATWKGPRPGRCLPACWRPPPSSSTTRSPC
jgi:hypothetical protein